MAKIKADLKLVEYVKQRRDNTDEELLDSNKQTNESIKKHRKTCRALSNMENFAKGEIAITTLAIVILLQRMISNEWSIEIALYVLSVLALGIYIYYNVLRLKFLDEGLRELLNHRVTIDDLRNTYKKKGVTI